LLLLHKKADKAVKIHLFV